MGRTMPIECEHGTVIDWGDFGPEDGPEPTCPECEKRWTADRPLGHDSCDRRISNLEAEVEALRSWKREAMEVLAEWEAVWEAMGRPGALGSSKAASVRRALEDRP
jgi:hypothetical protein